MACFPRASSCVVSTPRLLNSLHPFDGADNRSFRYSAGTRKWCLFIPNKMYTIYNKYVYIERLKVTEWPVVISAVISNVGVTFRNVYLYFISRIETNLPETKQDIKLEHTIRIEWKFYLLFNFLFHDLTNHNRTKYNIFLLSKIHITTTS